MSIPAGSSSDPREAIETISIKYIDEPEELPGQKLIAAPIRLAPKKPEKQEFAIAYENLGYGFYPSWSDQIWARLRGRTPPVDKVVLRGISGHFSCGEMTAVMGPSGSGKSILCECIIGNRINNLTGNISVHHSRRNLKISYIPQHDKVFRTLTCRETIVFASKLQNVRQLTEIPNETPDMVGQDYHNRLATSIMSRLGLIVCANTRVGQCSGGQQKRISIAMELVSRPDILVCDEPTSGLDSAACESVIALLRKIATSDPKVCVIVTIHQPAWHVFKMFHKVLMMSKRAGKSCFEASPLEVMPTLARYGAPCPDNLNPADFLIEVACSSEGQEVVEHLIAHQERQYEEQHAVIMDPRAVPLASLERLVHYPFFIHLWVLLKRATIIQLRDPWLLALRIAVYIGSALLIVAVFKGVGETGGCPPNLPEVFVSSDEFAGSMARAAKDVMNTYANISLLFYSGMLLMFCAVMPSMMTVANQINVVCKECFNKWYSLGPYYLAQCLVDIPWLVSLTFLYCVMHYFFNKEAKGDAWRFFAYSALQILNSMLSESQGYLSSVVFVDQPAAGMYMQPVMFVPVMLLSGFFVHFKEMDIPFVIASYFVHLRFLIDALLIIIYGYDRCGKDVEQKLTGDMWAIQDWLYKLMGLDINQPLPWPEPEPGSHNETNPAVIVNMVTNSVFEQMLGVYVADDYAVRSQVMVEYGLKDEDLAVNVSFLIMHYLLYRIFAYFILFRRVYKKN